MIKIKVVLTAFGGLFRSLPVWPTLTLDIIPMVTVPNTPMLNTCRARKFNEGKNAE